MKNNYRDYFPRHFNTSNMVYLNEIDIFVVEKQLSAGNFLQ